MSQRYSADTAAVLLLLLLTLIAQSNLLIGGTVIAQDTATFFYPMYTFLGESLRSGEIPVWNAYQMSGTPFAADPQSGWMYLPAMVFFAVLPVALAAKALMVFHLFLAGVGAYALARALGMPVSAALLSGIAYEFTGYLYDRNTCCFAYMVAAWLPFPVQFAELALRSRGRTEKVLWWALAGFAVSQVLAIWLGQGSYYALLVLGGYVAYRSLISPADRTAGFPARLSALALHGIAVLTFGLGLAAAGLLPRLDYNAVSNLAGGYPATPAYRFGDWSARDWAELLGRTNMYAGGATLALAIVAPFVARLRYGTPYWTALALGSLVLTGQGPTPLHWVLYHVLPGFARIHPRHPEARVIMVFYLCAAILAGATWSSLRPRRRSITLVALLPALIALALWLRGVPVPMLTALAAILASLLVAAYGLRLRRHALTAVLILLMFVDLLVNARSFAALREDFDSAFALRKVDIEAYYEPTQAGRFLLSGSGKGPFRVFGYDVRLNNRQPPGLPYWDDPLEAELVLNNRAMSLGLQNIQGYFPAHLARYQQYMRALNGRSQGYHHESVLDEGLTSPLLDVLNVRYILIPRPTPPYLEQLAGAHPAVYEDGRVSVVENRDALPRAWIVHSAQQVAPGEAPKLLASGSIDPRRTALIEAAPPPLAQPADSVAGKVSITEYRADRMRLRTSTSAPGLLVLSEMHYPAWKAYVDGNPAQLYVANHVLRAVAVPAGNHEVELRYESTALRWGLIISGTFYCLLLALLVLAGRRALSGAKGE
jgi:hypothetical protein